MMQKVYNPARARNPRQARAEPTMGPEGPAQVDPHTGTTPASRLWSVFPSSRGLDGWSNTGSSSFFCAPPLSSLRPASLKADIFGLPPHFGSRGGTMCMIFVPLCFSLDDLEGAILEPEQ